MVLDMTDLAPAESIACAVLAIAGFLRGCTPYSSDLQDGNYVTNLYIYKGGNDVSESFVP